jgi:uncharacterized pyridoxamine 5'-phosphate oxidase family protein
MSQIREFIHECGIYYLATNNGNQPKVRPLGFCEEHEGKVYFAVGNHKDVYKQLLKNPLCEVVAVNAAKHNQWIRYTGKAVFVDDPDLQDLPFKIYPQLRGMYEKLNARPAVFYLENAKAELRGPAGNVIREFED